MVVAAGPVSPLFGAVLFADSWHELEELAKRHASSPTVADAALPADSDARRLPAPVLRLSADVPFRVLRRSVLPGIDPERPRRLQAKMRERGTPEACRIMDQALAGSFGPSTVPELAESLGLSHWALIRRCRVLGIPTPKKLADLARVYTVERLAEWSDRPSAVAAAAVGCLDPANYRRTVRRVLGAPPTVVRQKGGAAHVGRAIVRRITPPQARPDADS